MKKFINWAKCHRNIVGALALAFIGFCATAGIWTEQQVFRGDVYFDHINWYLNGTKVTLTAAQLNATTNTTSGVIFSNAVISNSTLYVCTNDSLVVTGAANLGVTTGATFSTTGAISGGALTATGATVLGSTVLVSNNVTLKTNLTLSTTVSNSLKFAAINQAAAGSGVFTNWGTIPCGTGAATNPVWIIVQIGSTNVALPAWVMP